MKLENLSLREAITLRCALNRYIAETDDAIAQELTTELKHQVTDHILDHPRAGYELREEINLLKQLDDIEVPE
jgi:hypothetical protein